MGLSVLGIAVSIFIAFGNTQAINRWWEARTLWGGPAALEISMLCHDSLGGLQRSRNTPIPASYDSFSLPLNSICSTITADLMERCLDFGTFEPSRDPIRWDWLFPGAVPQ